MKKLYFTIVIILLFHLSVIGQYNMSQKFHAGMKIAPNVSWIKSNSQGFSSDGTKLGFGYGLMIEVPFNSNIAFASGFEIVSTGGKLKYPRTPDTISYINDDGDRFVLLERKYNLQYVNLPLTLKFKTNEIGYFSYYGIFGVDAGFRIKAKADDFGNFMNSTDIEVENVNIEKDINLLRLALNIGAGAEYNISGNTLLLLGLSFNNGFTNLMKKDSYDLEDQHGDKLDQNAVGNFIALNVGVLF